MKIVNGVMMRIGLIMIVGLLAVASPAALLAQAAETEGAAALGLALRRLGTTKRVLMIAAHPDDENTAVLSSLALGDGADVAYLSLTRGEGGQNLIGPELQEGLGLIRSEELLAARRLDGARQFFTRAYDYGFSKSADEAFSHWPRDSVLADVVAVIRRFRPDIIVSVFSGTTRDGHGQHQAAGLLARDGFVAAADPARFPAAGAAHRTRYLYQSLWRPSGSEPLRLSTGDYDPLLGRSHYQIAMASRSRHRSQDMGQPEPLGPRYSAFTLLAGERADDAASLFIGIDTTLADRVSGAAPELRAYQDTVMALRTRWTPLATGSLVAGLAYAHARLDSTLARLPSDAAARFHVQDEMDEVEDALRLAASVVMDATADTDRIVPGESFGLALSVWNGGDRPIVLRALAPRLPHGWRAEPEPADAPVTAGSNGATHPHDQGTIPPGSVVTRHYRVHVPTDAQPGEPYFLRALRVGDLYAWPDDPSVRGMPFEPAAVQAELAAVIGGVTVRHSTEVTRLTVDKAFGERRSPLLVVPAVSVAVTPGVLVLPLDAPDAARTRPLTVTLRSAARDTLHGTLRLHAGHLPIAPASLQVTLPPGAVRAVEASLTLPGSVAAGQSGVTAELTLDDGRTYARGYDVIDYAHIRPRALYRPAASVIRAMDVAIAPDLRVGYIEGAGDDGAAALRQLGADVVLLDSAALAGADLGRFDAIVAGIRAYEVRTDLVRHNERLLRYAYDGGTVVLQYNKYELVEGGFSPYALTMARPHGRVTNENAPVRLLAPEHRALSWPNRIGPSDFDGWVHERGLYFAETWDDAFTPLLAMGDPGEAPLEGSLLIAPYGRGHYVYTGLAFFRQFPEAVPGAYRLFANLVSLGARPAM